MPKILPKNKLQDFLLELGQEYEIWAPIKRGEEFNFELTNPYHTPAEKIASPYLLTMLPPKKMLFPQIETMMDFSEKTPKASTILNKKIVFFGLNIKDIHGLILLDRIFREPKEDFYYQKNRANTIIIGLDKERPIENEGFDLFLVARSKEYFCIPGTQVGRKLIQTKPFTHFRHELIGLTEKHPATDPILGNAKRLAKAVKASRKDEIWKKLGTTCLGCGICSYVCPICHCFEIYDEVDMEGKICRYRRWDGCMLSHFFKTATFDYKDNLAERYYNWYYHKFVRATEERGTPDCVNCGRCIEYCPANINFREVLEEILKKYG